VDRESLQLEHASLAVEATTLRWRGHIFRVTPDAFMQVNWTQMDTLYRCAIENLGEVKGARIVDAYAGIGVLPVHLASLGAALTCIESNIDAARLGVLNATLNDLGDAVHYVPRTAEDALPEVAGGGTASAVILDPPRAGCAAGVTGWLALAGPPRVVYISCDPATLARDLHVLVSSGPYAVERLDVVDMFPQTYHVESVVALRRTS
jgi:23S rRNA (uracil1939-C5)-methyltransferase